MTALATRPTRRAPAPTGSGRAVTRTTLWRIATVTRQCGRQLGPGAHVVLTGPSATLADARFDVIAPTPTGPLARTNVAAGSVLLLPPTYRARPCMAACGDDGDCWTLDRPGHPPRAHHDTLTAALAAAATHHARRPA